MNNLHNLTQVVSRSLDSEKPRAENLNFHGFKGCRIYLNVLEAERFHLFRHFSIWLWCWWFPIFSIASPSPPKRPRYGMSQLIICAELILAEGHGWGSQRSLPLEWENTSVVESQWLVVLMFPSSFISLYLYNVEIYRYGIIRKAFLQVSIHGLLRLLPTFFCIEAIFFQKRSVVSSIMKPSASSLLSMHSTMKDPRRISPQMV